MLTTAHQLAAWAAVAATIGLLLTASWSWWAGRSSGGRRDHRFAVDRVVLAALAVVAVAALLGLAGLAGGARPADPLHFLYGFLAITAVPAGWAIGGRGSGRSPTGAGTGSARGRRDRWLALAALILLGIELRLFLTG